jgi:hypothetical protein
MIFALIYVDDIIVTSSSTHAISALLQDLKDDFALKYLSDLNFFLGIQVNIVHDGLLLTKEKYATELLTKVGTKCTTSPTPLSSSEKLSLTGGSPIGTEDIT